MEEEAAPAEEEAAPAEEAEPAPAEPAPEEVGILFSLPPYSVRRFMVL